MSNDYYVYEWIRLDTNEPIYIGKGKGNRAYELKEGRNKHFKDVIKNRDVAVVILEENLSEEEALQLECWYIHEYKYEMGMEITNVTDGGDGVAGWYKKLSVEEKEQYSRNMTRILKQRYKDNPELSSIVTKGITTFMKSDEQRERAKQNGIKRHEENPDFFANIAGEFWKSDVGRAKASKQAKDIWGNQTIRNKILNSRKNSIMFRKNVHEANAIRFKDGGNPNARNITLSIDSIVYKFSSIKEAREFLNKKGILLVSDRTKKPLKKITQANFFKKVLINKSYVDYNGKYIKILKLQ